MGYREKLLAYSFVAPATLLIALFVFWPVANTFHTSLRLISVTDSAGRDISGLSATLPLDWARCPGGP